MWFNFSLAFNLSVAVLKIVKMVKSAEIERVKSIKLNLQYLAAGTLHEMLV